MAKFRKKPVVVEAFRYFVDTRPDWFWDKVSTNEIITYETHCDIKTLEGCMRAGIGDYIIQGVKKEIYPCKSDIFEQTYELVEET
jgi:response regulator of citrate/malate metabolism